MEEFDQLITRFLKNVKQNGSKKLYTFVDDKGKITEEYTYDEFEKETRSLAMSLLEKGCKVGEAVVLVYPPCLDFILAFVACLRAGLLAVPVYPPHPGRRKDINQFIAVQSSCEAKVALTNSAYDYAKKMIKAKKFFTDRGTNKTWPDLKWIVTNKIKHSSNSSVEIDASKPSDLAFLQYTSGSTSKPKGVMLSNNNLSHNLSCIIRALEADETVQVVSWLPQYHDMGLIGAYLGTLYCGGSGVYMSPFSFVKNPVLWLKQISLHRATHIQAPNFAYKLASRKFDKYLEKVGEETASKEINLESLRHIFNAAEPIDVNAMNNFKEKFSKYGLKPEAFSPGFGLAENSVYVSDRGSVSILVDTHALENKAQAVEVKEDESQSSSLLQGCGDPHRHPESSIFVRIVDKDGFLLKDECQVGEVWLTSPSKARGYFGLDELSETNLRAKLKIREGEEPSPMDSALLEKEWHRTGDLGFFHKRELFICGRIKDLIIIRGRNNFPQDIEFTVENNHDYAKHVRPGCSAAFSITQRDEEQLVVVAEVRNTALTKKNHIDLEAMAKSIAQAVMRDNEVVVSAISLIRQGTIVKTTSGKIKRFGNREAFLNKELKEVYRYQIERNKSAPVAAATDSKESQKDSPVSPKNQQGLSSAEILKEITVEAARLVEKDTSDIEVSSSLQALGMDSVFFTQFKALLNEKYGVEIDEEHLLSESLTLEKLSKYIHNKINGVDVDNFSDGEVRNSAKKRGKGNKKFFCC